MAGGVGDVSWRRSVGQVWWGAGKGGKRVNIIRVVEGCHESERVAACNWGVGDEAGCDGAVARCFGEVAELECPLL